MKRIITVIIACVLLLALLPACDATGATNITPALSPSSPTQVPSPIPATEPTPSPTLAYSAFPPTSSYITIPLTSQAYTTVPSGTKSLYPAGEVVAFKDKTVESSIRAALNIPAGDVTARDMERMQVFRYDSVNDKSATETINALDDLRYCVNLEILWLVKQPVSSIEPLRGLDKLSILFIPDCGVSDLSPLEGKGSLLEVRISGNPVSDASPVLGLPNLVEFNAWGGTNITDISALSRTSRLQNFYCSNKLKDYSPLLNQKRLRGIKISYIDDEFFKALLTNCKRFEEIRISDSSISDESLSRLAGWSLYALDLENCGLKDISSLADMGYVSDLRLSGNQIEDISALKSFTYNIYCLDLSHNKIKDLSPLESVMTSRINVSGNPYTDASKTLLDKLEKDGCTVSR